MEEEILKSIDYVAALGWTLLGIALVKAIIYPRGVDFSLGVWLKENLQDVVIGVIACPIIMQLGAVILNLLQYYTGIETEGIEKMLNEAKLSSVQLSLVLSMFIQWKLYKAYRNSNKNSNFDVMADDNGGQLPPTKPPKQP